MKEIKHLHEQPILATQYPLPMKYRFTKRWVIAQSRTNCEQQRLRNEALEAQYHRIVNTVKRLYLKPGEVFYDRDYKTDKTENCLAMHSFITPNFYFYLECEYTFDFIVNYDFCNCPFEDDILIMLAVSPMNHQAISYPLKPDFKTFYNNVLAIQDGKYLFSL